jgi:hypothetical protein
LGYNLFEADTPEATRHNIEHMDLPCFCDLQEGIDPALDNLLHRVLERKRSKRYRDAYDMLTALESHIYANSYGPTSEKLARYIAQVYPSA